MLTVTHTQTHTRMHAHTGGDEMLTENPYVDCLTHTHILG